MSTRSGGNRVGRTATRSTQHTQPRAVAASAPPTPTGRVNPNAGALGAALDRQARRIAPLSYERLVVHDRAGNLVHTVEGKKGTVGERGIQARIRGHFEMHNHPFGHDHFSTFTYGDIRSTIQARSIGTRVVTEGGIATILPRKDGTWPRMAEVKAAFDRYYRAEVDALRQRILNGTASARTFGTRNDQIMHRAWGRIARDFGLTYTRVPYRG